MSLLSETDRHQAKAIIHRMFEFGGDGRNLGRYLTAELGKPQPHYGQMREELLELMREVINSLYLQPAPKDPKEP